MRLPEHHLDRQSQSVHPKPQPEIPQMTTWSAHADATLETIYAMQAGLTVRLIMTTRDRLMTCGPDDSIDSLMAANDDRFSILPVVEKGVIAGLYRAEKWFDVEHPPRTSIGDDFERLTEHHLIGGNASILDFVRMGDERPTRLVVSGGEIVGLVCMADLHKLPVRAALFSVVTALEMAMADRIGGVWQDGASDWLDLLSSARSNEVKNRIASARRNDTYVSDISSTQFADKVTITLKQGLVAGSKTQLKSEFKVIRKLRDDLAHAKDYAATPSAARGVSRTVSTILRIASQLRTSAARSGNP